MKAVCILVQNVYDVDPRVRRKAEALVSAGYSVDVLALAPASGQKAYTLNGVNVYTLSLNKHRGSLARYLYEYIIFLLWAAVRLLLMMQRRRYAIVDVNTLPDFLIFAAFPARCMGAKLVLDMHEVTPEFYMSKYGVSADTWLIRILAYLERISFNFADRVVTINEPIRDLLITRGLNPSKCTVIMNSADSERFSDAAAVAQSDGFRMIYHGTLTRIYGLDIAIEAFALAQEDMPGAALWILGSGPETDALERLTAKLGLGSRVKLVGQVPSREIPSWLGKSDVGVLPIRRDVFLDLAFPNKLSEFIVTRKPVLVSRLKAIEHYFSDEAVAYFEPNDPADLARQMVRLYRDHDLRERLADRAVEEYFPIRWQLMKQRYLDVVGDLAGTPYVAPQATDLGEARTAER